MILTNLFSPSYSNSPNSTGNPSADVLAKVGKIMQAQNTGAPALNAALANDNTTLSGLGKLMSALTSFQSAAQSLSGKAAANSAATQDSAQIATKVSDLIGQYNALNTTLTGLRLGDLKSDAIVSRIQAQLARVFNAGSSGTVGAANLTPGSIGITSQKSGALAIDAAKLQNAVNANPEAVAKLFSNGSNGIADNFVSQIQSLISSTGSIQKEKAVINRDIASLNTKKSNLAKALTAQANALVKQYSQQDASGNSNGNASLFDMLG
ncbi:MAG: flagellar filament capping protein FliD [Proteobacteria bacterium]|nr:flagellar filament capping protein FliD [Pseudomonadota bacterium]